MSEADAAGAEEALGRAYDARLMRRLLGYLAPHRRLALGALALMLISSATQLVGPLATSVAIDLFLVPAVAADAGRSPVAAWVGERLAAAGVVLEPLAGVGWSAAVFLAALLATFVTLYAQGYLLQAMGQKVMADLRRDVFAQLQRLEIAYFDATPVGRLVTRVTADVDALNEMFTAGIVSIAGDVLVLAGIAAVLVALDLRLALATFAILPLLFLLTLCQPAQVLFFGHVFNRKFRLPFVK